MISIDLPWPPREMHPNARTHWVRRARGAKMCRTIGAGCTLAAGVRRGDLDIPADLKVTAIFSPPDNRRRDIDGMLSSIKSYLDGIADVIGIDDSKWQIAMRREAPVKGGSVRIELESAA
jgi:crossover junction endodeoxyribonuclease RusA